jgi:hypothetical protein
MHDRHFAGRMANRAHDSLLRVYRSRVFLLLHIVMIWLAGFWNCTRAMIAGRAGTRMERT